MKTWNLNTLSWGLGQKCPNTPSCILVHAQNNLKTYPCTTNFISKKKVRFVFYFHHLKCIPRDNFCNNHKPCLVYLSHVPKHGKGHWKVWKDAWNCKRIHGRWQQVAFKLNAHFWFKTGATCGFICIKLKSIYKGWRKGILLKDSTN